MRREEVAFDSASQCNHRAGAERGAGGNSHPQHPEACEGTWCASDQRISKGGIRTAWFEESEVKRIGLKNLMLAKPGFVDDEEGRE